MGLRVYTVHLPPPSSDDPTPTPALVKEGFSWPAFFLGVIWALWHRLWIGAAALFALFMAVGVILDLSGLGEPIESLILFAVTLLVGFNGNDWRRNVLRRRGFEEVGVVAGPNADSALRRFLDLQGLDARNLPARPTAGPVAGWYAGTVPPVGLGGYPPGRKAGA